MRFFKPSYNLKSEFSKCNVSVDLVKDLIIFLSTADECFVVKFDIKGYHIELVQILGLVWQDVYQSMMGFVFVLEHGAGYISFTDLISDSLDLTKLKTPTVSA